MYQLGSIHPPQFVAVAPESLDRLPDLHSVGLLAHLLRHQDDWLFDLERLVAQKPGLTKGAAAKAMQTLVCYGYVVKVKWQNAGGKWNTTVYRSSRPHTIEDLQQLAEMYQPGKFVQVARWNPADPSRPKKISVQLNKRDTALVMYWDNESARGDRLAPFRPGNQPVNKPPVDNLPVDNQANPQVTPTSQIPTVGEPTVGSPTVGNLDVYIEEEVEDQFLPPSVPPPPLIDGPSGYERGNDSSIEDGPQASAGALALIANMLNWGNASRRPKPRQAQHLALAVDQALAGGWTLRALTEHAQQALDTAKRNPASYLHGALTDHLPIPPTGGTTTGQSSSAPKQVPWCGKCTSESYRWIDDVDDNPYKCPRCNPRATSLIPAQATFNDPHPTAIHVTVEATRQAELVELADLVHAAELKLDSHVPF